VVGGEARRWRVDLLVGCFSGLVILGEAKAPGPQTNRRL